MAILALNNGFPPLVLVLRPYPHLLCAAPNLPLIHSESPGAIAVPSHVEIRVARVQNCSQNRVWLNNKLYLVNSV